ncbi:MAG: InlB B-repeat-containing protein [Methanimicrococcus sp.]|nr:InlB B-repeat-containing protein [Methanimicrococcus sp.]
MTKHQSICRIVPIVLAVALMLTLMPGVTLAASSTVDITGMPSVPAIQSAIQSAIADANAGDTVTVIGTFSGAGTTLTIDIPAGVTVKWEPILYRGSATAGPLIYLNNATGDGFFEVTNNTWLENTGSGNTLISEGSNATITVSEHGTVEANSGTAIEARGQNATVNIISGGSAFNEATTNVRPVIHMTNSTNPNTRILIDSGSVAALNSDFSDYAIQTYGDIEILGNSNVYADPGSGRAINALGASSTIIIGDNARVHTASGITIRTNDTNPATVIIKDNASVYNEGSNNVIWMPGGGSATIQDDAKVEAKGTGIAINSTGSVTVTDNAWVTASTGKAINSSATTVDGGFVFAYGPNMAQIITVAPTVIDPGVVVGWDHKKPGPFMIGSTDFLTVEPAGTAVWGIVSGKSGVIYTNGANTGFFPIEVELDTSAAEPVTGISLNRTTLTLVVGDDETLIATITPSNAVNQIVIWEIEGLNEPAQFYEGDPIPPSQIASISIDGTITGLSPGTVTVRATAADDTYGELYATCFVTVVPAPIIAATAGPNGIVSPYGDVSVPYKLGDGADKSFLIIPDEGYNISTVLVDNVDVGPVATYIFVTVTADHTIHATFVLAVYNITYNGLATGDVNTLNPLTFTITDLPITLEDAERDGYNFDGWYDAATGGNLVTDITTIGDKELWAVFDTTPIEYDIIYNGLETTDTNANPDTFDVTDLPFSLIDAERDGYNFDGWYDAATGGTLVTDITTTGDKELWAVFDTANPIEYDIIYNGLQAGDTNDNPDTFDVTDLPLTLVDAVRDGYAFIEWQDGQSNPVTSITTTGDKTLWAVFDTTPTVYNIVYNGVEGTDTNTNPATFDIYDLPFALDDLIRAGGAGFIGWFDAAVGGNQVTDITATGDKTLWARFEQTSGGNTGGGSGTGNATIVPPGNGSGGNQSTGNGSNQSSGGGNQSSGGGNQSSGNGSNQSSNASAVYTVIQHFGLYAGAGDSEGIIHGPLHHFVQLSFQGQVIDPANYVVSEVERSGGSQNEGNIVITLKESFDQTFDAGTYTFRAQFTDGYADLVMTVGDDSSQSSDPIPHLWMWLAILMLLAVFAMFILREDEEYDE